MALRLGVAGAMLVIFIVNLPFGYWRARTRKFTVPWFLAIHLPVPLSVGIRLLAGIGWRLSALPLFVGAFAAGQFLGGRWRYVRRGGGPDVRHTSAPEE